MAQVGDGSLNRLGHSLYREDLDWVASCDAGWSALDGATVAIAGATGLIGSFLTDVLLHKRMRDGVDVRVLALGRSEARARARLPHFGRDGFVFEELDVSLPGAMPTRPADVVLHLASTTHPRAYATQPVATIASNVVGLMNLLEYASACEGGAARLVFASSVEVYGENRGDADRFDEAYCGCLDPCTLRAGYPEAKRCGEALCQAFAAERGLRVWIPRLPRVYGPTILPTDTKALSQFIIRGAQRRDVVLKSAGTQRYSFLYVADAVAGLLHLLAHGRAGTPYNLADERNDLSLRDAAQIVADEAGTQVVFEMPDEQERAGYSTATKAMLDASRLRVTGWQARYAMREGLRRTVRMLGDFWAPQC